MRNSRWLLLSEQLGFSYDCGGGRERSYAQSRDRLQQAFG